MRPTSRAKVPPWRGHAGRAALRPGRGPDGAGASLPQKRFGKIGLDGRGVAGENEDTGWIRAAGKRGGAPGKGKEAAR